MTHRILLTIITFFSLLSLHAQISNGGIPRSFTAQGISETLPRITTRNINPTALLQEDLINDQTDTPLRFAIPNQVKLNLNNSGKWDELPNGDRIWRLTINCPNALSINLLYNKFYIPEGGEFFVYQPDGSQILGSFGVHNNLPNGKFATEMIFNNTLVVEYFEPKKLRGRARIEIGQINHGYRNFAEFNNNGGGSGPCQVDVNCSPEGDNWQTEKNSVARIIINGTGMCTGSLMNNTAEDGRQLFLTAFHCVDDLDAVSNPDASDYVFYWNFERTECGMNGSPNTATTTGATLLANHANSDFALFELHENPRVVADVYYNGWDASGNIENGGVSIHHPGGDFKKISTHSLTPTLDNWFNLRPANSHLKVQPWDDTVNGYSVTQSGSSGAPLFDNQKRVIGQLHGGSNIDCLDSAEDEGIFGWLAYSWNNAGANSPQRRLHDWLDPINNGATTVLNGKADFAPRVSFKSNSLEVIEEITNKGKDCATYSEYELRLQISSAPTAPALITVAAHGSATEGTTSDFVFSPSTFELNETKRYQDIALRIYNDALIENTENIVLTYQIADNGTNAITDLDNQQFFVEIESMDVPPTAETVTDITFQEDFENGLGSFTTTTTGSMAFEVGDAAEASSQYWTILNEKNNSQFAYISDDVCNCDLNPAMLISPVLNFSNITAATLVFDFAYSGRDYETLEVVASTDNGQTWSAPLAILENESEYQGNGSYQTDWILDYRIDLKNYTNTSSLQFAYRYSDGEVWNYGTGIDNVRILATASQNSTAVQMEVNSTEAAQAYLPPFTTVHFYDPVSKNIIATIENESDHDFGCTTVEVDRQGEAATYPFTSDQTTEQIFSKTIKITPEHQSTHADYILTTYHQPEEVSAWLSSANQSNTEALKVIKVAEDQSIKNINSSNASFYTIENINAIVSSFGDNLKITSTHFGALSAFGFGLEQIVESNEALPIELVYFSGKNQSIGNVLNWETAIESGIEAFQLERSLDGVNFTPIATIPSQQAASSYEYIDNQIEGNHRYFYRLKTIEAHTEKIASPVISIQTQAQDSPLLLSPNPFRNEIEITVEQDGALAIFNAVGQLIEQLKIAKNTIYSLNTNHWESGVYFIKMDSEVVKIVKR